MIAVIEQLEAWQGWEPSCVVTAKAFAAWRMREALGLELPDPASAQMHVDYQRQNFERWKHTVMFKREPERYELAPWERTLIVTVAA